MIDCIFCPFRACDLVELKAHSQACLAHPAVRRANALQAKLDAVMEIVNAELDLMSGHEGTDDWFCARSRSWFVMEDLEVDKDDYGVETVQCPCCEEPAEHLDLIMSPHAELTFDVLEVIKKAIAEAAE